MNREHAESLLAAYTFGALDPQTRSEVEAALSRDSGLRDQLRDMQMTAKLLDEAALTGLDHARHAAPSRLSDEKRAAILEQAGLSQPVASAGKATTAFTPRQTVRTWLRPDWPLVGLAAAAALVVGVLLTLVVMLPSGTMEDELVEYPNPPVRSPQRDFQNSGAPSITSDNRGGDDRHLANADDISPLPARESVEQVNREKDDPAVSTAMEEPEPEPEPGSSPELANREQDEIETPVRIQEELATVESGAPELDEAMPASDADGRGESEGPLTASSSISEKDFEAIHAQVGLNEEEIFHHGMMIEPSWGEMVFDAARSARAEGADDPRTDAIQSLDQWNSEQRRLVSVIEMLLNESEEESDREQILSQADPRPPLVQIDEKLDQAARALAAGRVKEARHVLTIAAGIVYLYEDRLSVAERTLRQARLNHLREQLDRD